MKYVIKQILIGIMMLFAVVIFQDISDIDYCVKAEETDMGESDIEEFERYLAANAKAYWKRGACIQYDDPEKYDQSLYFEPEEATKTHTMYSNCGAFVSALYMETFGIELPWRTENLEPYARANADTEYVVDCLEQEAYTDLVYNDDLVLRVTSDLRVGDLILLRFNTSDPKGHVIMVYELMYDENGQVCDAWVIHSTGSKDAEEHFTSKYRKGRGREEGTVRITRMSKLLRGFYSKLVDDKSHVYYYALIRPLANPGKWLNMDQEIIDYTVKESTKIRYEQKKDPEALNKRSIKDCYIPQASDMMYTGNNIVPVIQVLTSEEDGEVLQPGIDYIITYLKDDNINQGVAFVSVNGIGKYCDSQKVYFSIK